MTQPEALGYAVSLEARGFVAEAAELRRLHGENQTLRQALSNEFNPDWNQVEALQESLREHMAEIQRLRQALAQPDEVLAEREACAKLCDELGEKGYVAEGCAKAIRARSEK